MDYLFDKEKLKQVVSDFYNSTGIAVALYDASKQGVAGSPLLSPYCSHIRNREECIEGCSQSNLLHMKEVSLNRQVSRYTCHAGLMEMIFPVIYEGVLIAYIQIGQFRDAEHRYSSDDKLPKIAEKYGFSYAPQQDAFVCPEGATGSPPPLRGRQSWLLLALVSLRDRVSGLLVKQGPEDRASSHLWFSVTSLVPSAALQLEGRHPALWGTGLVSGAGPGWRKQVWSLVI